jgi:hypothetical protein
MIATLAMLEMLEKVLAMTTGGRGRGAKGRAARAGGRG